MISAAQKMFRSLVFMCVCASLWQAPIPWLHQHRANADKLADPQLALHLYSLHRHTVDCESGWHWHFVMLDDIVRGSGLPAPPAEGESPVLPKEHVVPGDCENGKIDSHAAPLISETAGQQTALLDLKENPKALSRAQFLGDMASSLRLHLVLCVARC